jgi:hypothetical protein
LSRIAKTLPVFMIFPLESFAIWPFSLTFAPAFGDRERRWRCFGSLK